MASLGECFFYANRFSGKIKTKFDLSHNILFKNVFFMVFGMDDSMSAVTMLNFFRGFFLFESLG
jgi:hypothetical protein